MESFSPSNGLHKIINGVAHRTEAAKRRERHIAYKRAGIPEIHLDTPIDELAKISVWSRVPTAKPLAKPVVYWIEADAMNERSLASWCYVLKSYLDAGMTARHAKVKHIIDAQFDSSEKSHWRSEIKSLDLIILDLTNSDNHKLLPTILADIHADRTRMKAMTIYLSDEDIGLKIGKYGDLLSRIFKDRKGIKRIAPRNSGSAK